MRRSPETRPVGQQRIERRLKAVSARGVGHGAGPPPAVSDRQAGQSTSPRETVPMRCILSDMTPSLATTSRGAGEDREEPARAAVGDLR